MFKVKVLTVGRCKESWLKAAIEEYEKRLQGKLSLEWHLAKDDAQLIQWIELEPFLVALDPQGALLTSENLSRKLMELLVQGGARLTFVIGGAEGLPSAIFKRPHFSLSLSPLTFTHQITRLILAEQLYRSLEIDRGSQYHK